MKIIRSAKCSVKFATQKKQKQLSNILTEYGRVCNFFIQYFWTTPTSKNKLLKPIIDLPNTWLSARLRKVAAREAIDMIQSVKQRWKDKPNKIKMPKHRGTRMCVSSTIAELQINKNTSEYDAWLHLHSIGNKNIINIPIKYHKHFNKWNSLGQRLNSYIITPNYVQFCFEINTLPKKQSGKYLGIDTGINHLATTSTSKHYGSDVKKHLINIKRKAHGSKRQQKARKALKQYIDEVARDIIKKEKPQVIVVEKLKNITQKTKKRGLSKTTRYFIGSWNYRYWLNRLQQQAELNRVSFRTVPAYNTSIMCSKCSHTDKLQRFKEEFICKSCGYTDHADINASYNILNRWRRGAYGPSCKS